MMVKLKGDKSVVNKPGKTVRTADLSAQLEKTKEQLSAKEEAYKRALADYQNLLNRFNQDKIRLTQLAAADLVIDLLPILDHLNLAVDHLGDDSVKMIRDELLVVLEKHGVQALPIKVNDNFDHEKMEVVETVDGQDGQVATIYQPGYQLNGQVIRHAKVAVGKSKANNQSKTQEEIEADDKSAN